MRGAHSHILETILGAVVLALASLFLVFAYTNSQLVQQAGGYPLIAKFDRIDGLKVGSDVRLGGVIVGKVTAQSVNPETFLAEVTFQVSDALKLPMDTSAEVVSDGLLGDKYVSLVPGGDEETLEPGAEVEHTQSAVNLETLIGKAVFSGDKGDSDG
ncbi:MAG: outer membrane lipid asymmetry maintenance protein MlaD [bacterium]|nr:outer membrane lipid asymmetry maintenance protein MlaD [bacterium]